MDETSEAAMLSLHLEDVQVLLNQEKVEDGEGELPDQKSRLKIPPGGVNTALGFD